MNLDIGMVIKGFAVSTDEKKKDGIWKFNFSFCRGFGNGPGR